MGKVEEATQRSLAAQSRRKKWGTKDNIFYKTKSGKITNMSNYNAKQFHTAYSKILGGKSSSGGSSGSSSGGSSGSSSGGRGGGSSSNQLTQILRHGANNAMAQYQHAMADSRVSLVGLNKNQLLQILSQTLQRQSKGGH